MYLEIFRGNFAVFRVFLGISRDFAEIPEFRRPATARNIRSPVLCSTQIPLTQYRPESLMLRSKAISNGLYGAITATRAHSSSSPICTSRLIFDKGGFFHLVLSEYANQSHNFKNVNFSSLYGKQDVNTKIWGQLRALGCTIKEATYYH